MWTVSTKQRGGSGEQEQDTRQRVPGAEVLTFPGGHLTTSEHPDLLAAAIRGIAARHGAGTPPPPADDTTP